MEIDQLVDHLAAQGPLLIDSARAAGLATPVPSCPDWSVEDLLSHTGFVHRWAAAHVAGPCAEPLDDEAATALIGPIPDGEALFDWYADAHTTLVETLRQA